MLNEAAVGDGTVTAAGGSGDVWPSRLLGLVPWILAAAVGVAATAAHVTPVVWTGAGLVAGLSLSGSI